MFWSSKSLPWLIPTFFLTAPPDGQIAVVSPWVENVNVQVHLWDGRCPLDGGVSLLSVLQWLHVEKNLRFAFFIRADQLLPTINQRLTPIYTATSAFADFKPIADLHAKILVTDALILETSANLLTRSLYRNVEVVNVRSNPFGNTTMFVRDFFGRHGVRNT